MINKNDKDYSFFTPLFILKVPGFLSLVYSKRSTECRIIASRVMPERILYFSITPYAMCVSEVLMYAKCALNETKGGRKRRKRVIALGGACCHQNI